MIGIGVEASVSAGTPAVAKVVLHDPNWPCPAVRTVTGKPADAIPLLDSHLKDYPRDALMLSLRSGAIFYGGGVRKPE